MRAPISSRTGAAALAVMTAASEGRAGLLPIVNPSFEMTSRALEPGECSNGAGGAGVDVGTWRPLLNGGLQFTNPVQVPGWRTNLPTPVNPTAQIRAGVLRNTDRVTADGPRPYLTGVAGEHVAACQSAFMQQTLDAQLEAGTRYRLSFLSGFGVLDNRDGVYVALLAAPDRATLAFTGRPDIITLVQTQGIIPAPDQGGLMQRYTIEYTSPATLPPGLGGRYLAICFIGSDGIPRMCFDDFSLDAQAVPDPGASALLALAAAVRRARRR